jgi:toxin ParE1/3/4
LPRRNPLVPHYEHQGIRRRVHADFVIFYRVGTECIDIIRILNGALDYDTLLFPSAK